MHICVCVCTVYIRINVARAWIMKDKRYTHIHTYTRAHFNLMQYGKRKIQNKKQQTNKQTENRRHHSTVLLNLDGVFSGFFYCVVSLEAKSFCTILKGKQSCVFKSYTE